MVKSALIPTYREWSGTTIQDRVDLVLLQIHNSLCPEVTYMANQMLDEAGCAWGDTDASIDALDWGFKNRFYYLPDPFELDHFGNAHRLFLTWGGKANGTLDENAGWAGDCDDSSTVLGALGVSTARRTGIQAVGVKVIAPDGRNFVHIYEGMMKGDGKIVWLDATVATAVPNWQPPPAYRKKERVFWFDPSKFANVQPQLSGLVLADHVATLQMPLAGDVDRSSVRARVDGLINRCYRSLRDPLTRISAIHMIREAGCRSRDELAEAKAMLDGVRNRFQLSGPVGGSIRTLGQVVNGVDDSESVVAMAGDEDDAAMALCSLTLVIGFRTGVRALPDGQLRPVVEMPRSRSKNKVRKTLDLDLATGQAFYGKGGNVYWYQERH